MDEAEENCICDRVVHTEEEEKPSISSSNSSTALYHLREFSEFLVKALNSIPDQLDMLKLKYLKCDAAKCEEIVYSVPCYRMRETAYVANQFIKNKTDIGLITHFSSDCTKLTSATYTDIQIKRKKYYPALTEGWVFTHYKEVGFALYFMVTGLNPHISVYFNPKDREDARRLIDNIRKHVRKYNFLKGEKLKVVNGYILNFLEYSKMDWNEVILEETIKDEVMLNLIFPIENRKLCKTNSVPWRRGILVSGEPGTGKTQLAKVLCNVLKKVTVIWVSAEGLTESYHVRTLFDAARYLAPTLIIMEDIDFFGKNRAIERNPLLGELLNQLDGSAPNDGVFVMASSNFPGILDQALANRPGRFDVKLKMELPGYEERIQMLKLFSIGKKLSSDIQLTHLATITNGLTGAHIRESLTYATLDSLSRGYNQIHLDSIAKAVTRLKKKETKGFVR